MEVSSYERGRPSKGMLNNWIFQLFQTSDTNMEQHTVVCGERSTFSNDKITALEV